MICPYCKDVASELDAVQCPSCGAHHHSECWEAHGEMCSVYGCHMDLDDGLLGCPWCEEVYSSERRICMICGSPLRTSMECSEFVRSRQWAPLPIYEAADALLAAGYLRNNGIVTRISRRAPVSMFRIGQKVSLWVDEQQEEEARELLRELFERFTYCATCGHVLFIDEDVCSYCEEWKKVGS